MKLEMCTFILLYCTSYILDEVRLTTSHSQRLNSGKPLGTGYCEWLWSIGTLPYNTLRILSIYVESYKLMWNALQNTYMDAMNFALSTRRLHLQRYNLIQTKLLFQIESCLESCNVVEAKFHMNAKNSIDHKKFMFLKHF